MDVFGYDAQMDTHLEVARYDKLKTDICYCKSPNALDAIVSKIIGPTGFGSYQFAQKEPWHL